MHRRHQAAPPILKHGTGDQYRTHQFNVGPLPPSGGTGYRDQCVGLCLHDRGFVLQLLATCNADDGGDDEFQRADDGERGVVQCGLLLGLG